MVISATLDDEERRALRGVDFDFYAPEYLNNPYTYYARLRKERPVAPVQDMNAWFLTRYEDVRRVALDETCGMAFEQMQVNRMGPGVVDHHFFKFGKAFMAFSDPPYHTRVKKLFMQGFTRTRAEQFVPTMRQIADGVIDEFIADGHADITRQYAHETPLRIVSALLGVPPADQAMLESWVRAYTPVIGFPPMTDEQILLADEATLGFEAYFTQRMAERRTSPGPDLISELMQVNDKSAEPISDFQFISNLILLYFAGQDTQKSHFGNILVALHEHPDQLAWLLEDPSRVWASIPELARYDGVSQITARVAFHDIEISGELIRSGQTILLGIGAANRDPEIFPDPDRLDLTRSETREVISFGMGRHACVGANFARLSIPVMLEALLTRLPGLKVDFAGLVRNKTLSKRGYGSIPASWS